jgi:hypothetical protein
MWQDGWMQSRFSPMGFAAIYAFAVPLILGVIALLHPLRRYGLGWLSDWQTLVTGALAILAAVVGGAFVFGQTRESRRQADEALAREHFAARAVLPLALSAIVDYAEAVVSSLTTTPTYSSYRAVVVPSAPYVPPDFDTASIMVLRDVIESASPEIGDRVATLLARVQVLAARLRALAANLLPSSRAVGLEHNAVDYTIDAAVIFARASALFRYARRETDDAPDQIPSPTELTTALNLLGFDAATTPALFERVAT